MLQILSQVNKEWMFLDKARVHREWLGNAYHGKIQQVRYRLRQTQASNTHFLDFPGRWDCTHGCKHRPWWTFLWCLPFSLDAFSGPTTPFLMPPMPQIPHEEPAAQDNWVSQWSLSYGKHCLVQGWSRGPSQSNPSVYPSCARIARIMMDLISAGHCKETIQQKHRNSTTSEAHSSKSQYLLKTSWF